MKTKKKFIATVDAISSILEWIRGFLKQNGVPIKATQKLEIAVEEAIANVVFHAYEEKGGDLEIAVAISPTQVSIEIRDWAHAFDPLLQAPKVDIESPLEERKEGGLGIHLMKQLVDTAQYLKEQGSNLLILTIFLK